MFIESGNIIVYILTLSYNRSTIKNMEGFLMKKVSILTLVLALALFFTGCTNGELQIYNAFLKSQDILSMESRTDISFKLSGEGLSEENQVMLDEASKMLNSSKISMNQKMVQNKDKTIAKAKMDMGIDMDGVKTDMELWVTADMSKDTPEILEVFKLPQMLMASFGEENQNKEYIVYDFNELMEMQEAEIDYAKIMDWSKEMQPKLTEFLKEYAKNFDSGIKVVESKGSKTVNNQVVDIYELKLNDESFKSLMRYSVNNLIEDENVMKFMTEYMDIVLSTVEVSEEEKQELNKEIDKMKGELPNIKEGFNKFMDEMNEFNVLGDEGIVIEYAINKDGYIISEKGFMDISLNLKDISSKLNEEEMKGIVKLKIEFDTKVSKINEGLKIEMPKLTEENSFNLTDLMNSLS